MKIISLELENILKFKAAYIEPNGDIVMVQGDNEAGKSSVLDSIVMALKSARSMPDEPIHKGAKSGKITIKMDGIPNEDDPSLSIPPFTIVQTITGKGQYVKITPSEILAGQTSRQFLDNLIGSVSFDPLEFMGKEGKEQRDILLQLTGIDTSKLDAREKDIFDERTEAKRDLDSAQVLFNSLIQYPEVVETEELAIEDLVSELTAATEFNRELVARELANNALKSLSIRMKTDTIPELKLMVSRLTTELETAKEALSNSETQLDKNRVTHKTEKESLAEAEPKNVDTINESLSTLQATNEKIRANIIYSKDQIALEGLQSLYTDQDNLLKEVRADRIKMLTEAKMPVDELTFDDSSLLYGGLPLSQASDSRKLIISLLISMALNPKVKILRVKDGSLLGPKNLKLFCETVKDKGYQLWIEKVNDQKGYEASGEVGIFIEEGEITIVDGKKPKDKPKKKAAPKKSAAKKSTDKKSDSKKVEDKKVNGEKAGDGDTEAVNAGDFEDW